MGRRVIPSLMLVVFLIIALASTACGAPVVAPPTATTPATKPPVATPPSTTTPAATAAGPAVKAGGILRLWMDGEPGGYDPQRKLLRSPNYCAPIFNNLVRFDITKQQLAPANLQGDLAERWDVSPDGKTYTFYLVKNAKWHDGKAFNADDVVGNLKKLVDPKQSLMSTNFKMFSDAVKVDDYTVKVTLKEPQPSFLPMLASVYAVMVPLHINADFKTTAFLVGTGPFKFKQYTAGVSFNYEKNPDYFRKDAQGIKLPYLDGLTIHIISERNAQVDALVTKRVDMSRPALGVTNMESVTRYKNQSPEVVLQWWLGDGQVIHMNQKFKALSDVRVRQAMVLVTDMELAIIGGFGSGDFRGTDGTVMPPAYSIGKAEKYKLMGWDQPYTQRVASAKKLMAEAGYPDGGFKVRLLIVNVPELIVLSQALADQWKRSIGVETQIDSFDSGTVNDRRAKGEYELYMSGLNSMAGDPDEIMTSFSTGGIDNRSFYSNPEVDRLNKEQSLATDVSKRILACKDIERQIIKDAVVIPQGWLRYATGLWPYVKGYVQQDASYGAYLQMERVWLDK